MSFWLPLSRITQQVRQKQSHPDPIDLDSDENDDESGDDNYHPNKRKYDEDEDNDDDKPHQEKWVAVDEYIFIEYFSLIFNHDNSISLIL